MFKFQFLVRRLKLLAAAPGRRSGCKPPLEIVGERYARGETDRAEYGHKIQRSGRPTKTL